MTDYGSPVFRGLDAQLSPSDGERAWHIRRPRETITAGSRENRDTVQIVMPSRTHISILHVYQ
jgi:hypothetical protein